MGDDNGRVPSGSYPQQAYNGDVRVSPQPAHAIKSPPTTTDHYNHTESIWRIVVDILSLSVLLVVTVISHYVAQPFLRGFYCSDTTIKYPYKENTIPTYAAVILSIALPIIWMWTTELCKLCYFKHYKKDIYRIRLELCAGSPIDIKPIVRNLYILTVIFAYGYLSTWVLLEVTKNFIGRPRPHFISVCRPNFDCSAATDLYRFNTYVEYGTNYTCLNTDDALVREARRSFFSGHTAPLFYGLGFLIMYIHISWSWRHLGVVGHVFQTGFAVLASYVGYTRVTDYHHHWQDVLVGAIVGSLIAFATFKFILNWRHYDPDFLPHIVSKNRSTLMASQNGSASLASNAHSEAPMMHSNYAGQRRSSKTPETRYAEVAETDSDSPLALEPNSEEKPLCRYRTSSADHNRKKRQMDTNATRYNSSVDQNKYRDESAIDSKRFPSVEVTTRSRQSVAQPVSLLKLVFDGISLLIVLLTWLLFKYLVKPVQRAFLCSDLNLYHPPPQKKVIPTWLLFICAIIIPLIFILLSEGVRWYYLVRRKSARFVYKIQFRSKVYNVPEWAGNLYIIVGVFLFANCVNSFLTNVGKVSVGRLRPHFIPSCFQKYSYRDFCTDPNQWIVNYTCLGDTSSVVKEKDGSYDIRQSFPSGHASSAFCGLIFLALYIHKVWNYRNIGLFPYVMQMLCFALAAYIGITRITDNRHHATDVLSGAILGTVVAIIGFRYMVNSFKRTVMLELDSRSNTY